MHRLPDFSFTTTVVSFMVVLALLTIIYPEFVLDNLLSIILIGLVSMILLRVFRVSLLTIVVFSLSFHLVIGGALYLHDSLHGISHPDAVEFILYNHIKDTEIMINSGITDYRSLDPLLQSKARYHLFVGSMSEFPVFIFIWLSVNHLTSYLRFGRRQQKIEFEGTNYRQREKPEIINSLFSMVIAILIMGFILEPVSGTYIPGIIRIMLLLL